ncbi:helicase-related protein [Clostridium gasigenes]|uniref:helicase-related protein n=1 Tax=Clostridium gasigenes TaxID=94869 RepID=UPI001C0AF8C9|nr:helicase-related protein [Clostridium gasigenes]MBU3105350.1 RNA helicase [Clostridium gasigenes]
MKKNSMQREFKKLKGQINQIEEIVYNSKPGVLLEHEATIRKKIRELQDMSGEGFKEYNNLCERYDDLLEYVSKKILSDYNKKNDTSFDYYKVVRGQDNSLINSGIMTVLVKHHIPDLISKEFEKNFPANPKDEYREARFIKRKFYIHLGDTNTGKTYNAIERLKKAKCGIYLSPLRILALENYERMNNEGVICDLLTGEEEIITIGATHTSCTVEKLNIKKNYEIAVIDEIQMIGDSQRGDAWTKALLGIRCNEIHLCGALNAKEVLIRILEDCGEEYELIEYKRQIPLEIDHKSFYFKDAQPGDAIVVFSKKRVLEIAESYSKQGVKASIIYGDLPPEVRRKQYEQFVNKETNILITTDAIGMGVNLPIKRIVFLSTKKFDGYEIRDLTSQEVKQIAGRAGRKGIYEVGYVLSIGGGAEFLQDKLEEKDRPVYSAVIGPSEAILKIRTLPLNEKLAIWSTREETLNYYRKMDITEYIIVLDNIKRYKLKEEIQWNLLKIPFDVSEEVMLNAFLDYVEELFLINSKEITKPQCFKGNLDDLEIYYQKVNLYYSFSKVFNLPFDAEWIYNERREISNNINEILLRI